MVYLQLCAGFVFLIAGAKFLVRSSSHLASIMGVPPLIVGLTIVAYGTNSPELLVSVQAALMDKGEIAIGNVVGSNIFNILGVLGISALVRPLRVCETIFQYDVPILIGVSLLLLFLGVNGSLSWFEGILLLVAVTVYTAWVVMHSRKAPNELKQEFKKEFGEERISAGKIWLEVGLIVLGLILLVFGSKWFVLGASAIAKMFGISDVVIGLTLVAIGSSLPELATSVYATWKGEYDIAVGNMIGSNIFNILGVLGFAAIFSKLPISIPPHMIRFDIPIMVIATVLAVPLTKKGPAYGLWKGVFFILLYLCYTAYLIFGGETRDQHHYLYYIAIVGSVIGFALLAQRKSTSQ